MAVSYSLNDTPILILDGAMGTYLEDRHGVIFDETKPAWSSSVDRNLIRDVHTSYLEAGADILLTATYQATLDNILPPVYPSPNQQAAKDALRGLADETISVVNESTRAAAVALSISAYGGTMKPSTEYTGEYPEDMKNEQALGEHFLDRLRPYYATESPAPAMNIWSRLSYIAFETLVCAEEVAAARRAMYMAHQEVSISGGKLDRHKFWVCCNYPDNSASGLLSPCGEEPLELVRASLEPGRRGQRADPWGIGINCTKLTKLTALILKYEEALQRLAKNGLKTAPWLVLYPDGAHNLRYDANTKTWVSIRAEGSQVGESISWAKQVMGVISEVTKRGKWPGIVVGGCCKTTPFDIAELAQHLSSAATAN